MYSFLLCLPPKHTKLHRLIAEDNQLTLSSVECINKAMEGRSCSIRELDLKQSSFLFGVNWVPSRKGAMGRMDEVGVGQRARGVSGDRSVQCAVGLEALKPLYVLERQAQMYITHGYLPGK